MKNYSRNLFLDTTNQRLIFGTISASAPPPLEILWSDDTLYFDVHFLQNINGVISYLDSTYQTDISSIIFCLQQLKIGTPVTYATYITKDFFATSAMTVTSRQSGGSNKNTIHRFAISGFPVGGYFALSLNPTDFSTGDGRKTRSRAFNPVDWELADLQEDIDTLYGAGQAIASIVDDWTFDIEYIGTYINTNQTSLAVLSTGFVSPAGIHCEIHFDTALRSSLEATIAPPGTGELPANLTLRVHTAGGKDQVYFSEEATIIAIPETP